MGIGNNNYVHLNHQFKWLLFYTMGIIGQKKWSPKVASRVHFINTIDMHLDNEIQTCQLAINHYQ